MDLPLLLGLVVAFGVAMYVIMDGFDLGVGILFPFAPSDADRDLMMSSIAPIWDGNETWLVLGGTLLVAAFPGAYATLLPAFCLPLVLMLFALIFRGLAFEFRFRARRFRYVWDWAFSGGSMLAGFCQGVILGAFTVRNGAFAGGTFQFASAFAVVCGLGLVAGYALLGATWLIFKASGTTGDFGRRMARPALFVSVAFIALISFVDPHHTRPGCAALVQLAGRSSCRSRSFSWRMLASASACGPMRCRTLRPSGKQHRPSPRSSSSASASS
jgi:cytochrome d ubiquinol oxidase subunit II